MYLDANLLFSQEQEITATCSSKVLALSPAKNPLTSFGAQAGATDAIGAKTSNSGTALYPFVQVTQNFEGITSLTIELQTCADKDYDPSNTATSIPDDDDWQTIATSESYSLDKMNKLGFMRFASLPASCARLIRLRYVVTGTPTAGSVTSGLAMDLQS